MGGMYVDACLEGKIGGKWRWIYPANKDNGYDGGSMMWDKCWHLAWVMESYGTTPVIPSKDIDENPDPKDTQYGYFLFDKEAAKECDFEDDII
ncbi:MAG: hypothetical protein LBH47_03865, partial [Christensenellaceae bacterium]|nr:hypothetical protein [Christensenellaceae bacterium]